jgi:hypothetical protein
MFERAQGDVDRVVIVESAALSRRGLPGLRVSFAHLSAKPIFDAVEDELLDGHAASPLEAGGRGAGEHGGIIACPAMGGYRRRAQERLLHLTVERKIAAEAELL